MEIDLNKITEQIRSGLTELLDQANLHAGDLVVLGCSTSEIKGEHIGKYPSVDVGRTVVSAVMEVLKPRKLYLAVQGCEHLNRALVVERKIAEEKKLRNRHRFSKRTCRRLLPNRRIRANGRSR